MEALAFLIDFITDINVYIAGAIVYLFPGFVAKVRGWF